MFHRWNRNWFSSKWIFIILLLCPAFRMEDSLASAGEQGVVALATACISILLRRPHADTYVLPAPPLKE